MCAISVSLHYLKKKNGFGLFFRRSPLEKPHSCWTFGRFLICLWLMSKAELLLQMWRHWHCCGVVCQCAGVGFSHYSSSSLCAVADFVLDISMIHAWCDGWPGGLQNLCRCRTRLHVAAWTQSIIKAEYSMNTEEAAL